VTVNSSTFVGNSATSGGAIESTVDGYLSTGALMTVDNSIFYYNSASGSSAFAAGIANYVGSTNVNNSVFFRNLAVEVENDCLGCTSNINPTTADPTLAPLGNFGGPTQTILPLPGSPAICAGSASLATGLTTDQRGFPRTTSYTGNGGTTTCVDAGAVGAVHERSQRWV